MRVHDKRTALVCFGLAIVIVFAGVASGCAKDVNPPVIQQSQMPEWAVEDETIDLSVGTTDDRGVKEVYIQFDPGEKIPLAKADSKKNGEEVANWKASFRLSPKDYSYSIVARDTANETKKEGKITVYSKNSLYGYARGKGIDTYLSQLVSLEKDGTLDQYGKACIDLVAKYPKAGELAPGIYAEILKLPDFMTIDEKDIEAFEDMLMLASDPRYKDAFESMLSEGIPDERKYCSPLEALLWIAYDKKFDKPTDNPLENFSLERLLDDAWKNTTTSRNYKSDRWDYESALQRLNSPVLAEKYVGDTSTYDLSDYMWYSPRYFFDKKQGNCMSYSGLVTHFPLNNGYFYDEFEAHETNAACTLGVIPVNSQGKKTGIGHQITVVKIHSKYYCYDATKYFNDRGPFETLGDIASRVWPDWAFYWIAGDTPVEYSKIVGSKDFNKWMRDETYRKKFRQGMAEAGFNPTVIENIINIYDKYN